VRPAPCQAAAAEPLDLAHSQEDHQNQATGRLGPPAPDPESPASRQHVRSRQGSSHGASAAQSQRAVVCLCEGAKFAPCCPGRDRLYHPALPALPAPARAQKEACQRNACEQSNHRHLDRGAGGLPDGRRRRRLPTPAPPHPTPIHKHRASRTMFMLPGLFGPPAKGGWGPPLKPGGGIGAPMPPRPGHASPPRSCQATSWLRKASNQALLPLTTLRCYYKAHCKRHKERTCGQARHAISRELTAHAATTRARSAHRSTHPHRPPPAHRSPAHSATSGRPAHWRRWSYTGGNWASHGRPPATRHGSHHLLSQGCILSHAHGSIHPAGSRSRPARPWTSGPHSPSRPAHTAGGSAKRGASPPAASSIPSWPATWLPN